MTSVESIPPILLGGVPVVQPPHLEGDSTLATEILPGPPSLLSLQQQGNRKDTKKPSASLSYLPVSDPGSTYSALAIGAGATTMMNSSNVDGPRRKRARMNKGASSARPQRASARVLNPSSAMTDMATSGHEAATAWSAQLQAPLQESSMPPSVVDADELVFSRSNSADDIQFVSGPANGMGTKERTAAGRKDKGKGKEKEKPGHLLRVKEEPVAITFNQNDYGPPLPNEDHCSACQYLGSLVYCDGCPKAFHLWCLDPPMEPQDLPEGENRWFCPACVIQNNPTSKLPASLKFMSPLIHQLQCTMPSEFRLPDEIRTTFKDVATGPRGTYVDSSEIKPPRLNRHGQLEDRDPHRLKDRSGDPILCYQCGMSALPSTDIAPPPMKRPRRASNKLANTDTWTSMISCDYCDLNWHLDCLDPPVASMPTFGIKWMCPNHAEQVHKPKRRILKQNTTPIEITKPNQPNNGNIEIINNIFSLQEEKVLVDEISINGRRYRVPERVVKLDFWNKVNGTQPIESSCESPLSSPLTPLSSLEDFDELPIKSQPTRLYSIDDISAAQLLWSLQARAPSVMPVAPVALNGTLNSQDVNVDNQIPSRHHSPARHQTSPEPKKIKIDAQTTVEPTTSSKLVEPPTISMPPAAPREQPPLPQTRSGRRRSARKPAPSTKRVKVDLLDDTSSDSRSTSTASQPPKAAKAADNPFAVPKSVPSLQKSATSATTVDSNAKQNRPSTIEKPVNGNGKPLKAALPAQSTTPPAPHVPKSTKTPSKKSLMITKTGKSVSSVAATPIKSESSTSPKPNSTTPSLKIRLPRLSDITSVSASTSTVTATASRTNSTGESGRGSIARRLSRRQTSTSTS